MEIKDIIEILQAYERGEQIKVFDPTNGEWNEWAGGAAAIFTSADYSITPKKKMTLVEELRTLNPQFYSEWKDLAARAADRIEDLEGFSKKSLYCYTTDELLADIKRRIEG